MSNKCQKAFRNAILNRHNYYRSLHDVTNLQNIATIERIALNFANKLASENQFYHSGNHNYGENLSIKYQSHRPFDLSSTSNCASIANDFVDSWYNEIKDYDWSSPGFTMTTGHFTQVVWKSSNGLGCGLASFYDGSYWYSVVGVW